MEGRVSTAAVQSIAVGWLAVEGGKQTKVGRRKGFWSVLVVRDARRRVRRRVRRRKQKENEKGAM